MHDHSKIHFRICCVGDSRGGEVSEFGEGGLDTLLELLGPPQPSGYCWHILIHWSPTWEGQESLLTQVLQYIITIYTYNTYYLSCTSFTKWGCTGAEVRRLSTRNKNINMVFAPIFNKLNSNIYDIYGCKIYFLVQICEKIHAGEHRSFAKRIRPPNRCGISIYSLNNMIFRHVHLRLVLIKGHSTMCSIFTQLNASDVACFEGMCGRHAGCRNVHWSCCAWTVPAAVSVVPDHLTVHPISLATADHVCPHQSRTSTSGFFTCMIVWEQPPVCKTQEFLPKRPETVPVTLICLLVFRTGFWTWLQLILMTDFSGKMDF